MLMLKHVLNLPTPSKMKYFWNFGSILAAVLGIQVMSGVVLCLNYVASSSLSFLMIDKIVREVKMGDVMRKIHSNGATLFFLFLYLHTGRGLYYSSYKKNMHVWMIGLTMLILSMGMAFLGYVLPWGQMSYWGATVITNLASVVPLIGSELVKWMWGGFSVNSATLTRFLGLHMILPLVLCAMVGMHMVLLHSTGSSNSLGVKKMYSTFHPYWTKKDMFGMFFVFCLWCFLVTINPYLFMDSEKFLEAKFLVTPIHIQPEWYFLPAYAVLRSIPKKLGGVIGLLMVYAMFYFKPFFLVKKMASNSMKKMLFWQWMAMILGLLWIGSCVVDGMYMILGQIFTLLYFILVLLMLSNSLIKMYCLHQ